MKIEQQYAYIFLTTTNGVVFCYNTNSGEIYKVGTDTDGTPIMRPITKKEKDAVITALIYKNIGVAA